MPNPLPPPSGSNPLDVRQQPIRPKTGTAAFQAPDKAAFLLNSPFARMFSQAGGAPTAQEMHAIMNGILQTQVERIKKEDAHWKEAMKKLKDTIEGND